ncbi:MAG TPA: phosphate ABC transporter substrate-binding/OmpA family protein [Anaeromyxobacteraceae bacterium]|nr:phosphate ABC transporter substrate-binding/OmpA family protein [Anaeromyxobacteraceae bacterium]
MTVQSPRAPRGGALGSLVTILLVLALVGLGAWLVLRDRMRPAPAAPGGGAAAPAPRAPEGKVPEPIEPVTGSPQLAAPAAYEPKDGVVEIDLSEYAGYGGLVVANGGLDPSPDSFFAKQYGFRVKLTVSEEESWSKLNNGRLAASATTADALAVLGRQFEVTVPAQIGFSRGADMVVVDQGIASVNGLAGKVLAGSQFNESEFFLRYLAREAGLPVRVLRDLDARPGPGEVGLVFYEDAFAACDAYQAELARGRRLNGCVGWTPKTDEVIEASAGRAKALVTNRNLLVVADVLVVNRGFAEKHPDMVKGLVHGLLEGNRRLRDQQAANLATVAKAFKWSEAEARDELAKVHLSNLPENRAFFQGTIDAAGSFGGIFQSSVLAYGSLIRNPADASRFHDPRILEGLQKAGLFADQKIAIAPIRTQAGGSLEGDPLLKKDVRFFFEPNSAVLDRKAKENAQYLDTVKQFLQVSPGSVVVLRGHVDDARVPEFRKQGGEELVRSMALKAMELSRQRALAVREALLERHKGIDPKRLEAVGRGWEEPAGKDSALNRRVEVQWFTLE